MLRRSRIARNSIYRCIFTVYCRIIGNIVLRVNLQVQVRSRSIIFQGQSQQLRTQLLSVISFYFIFFPIFPLRNTITCREYVWRRIIVIMYTFCDRKPMIRSLWSRGYNIRRMRNQYKCYTTTILPIIITLPYNGKEPTFSLHARRELTFERK